MTITPGSFLAICCFLGAALCISLCGHAAASTDNQDTDAPHFSGAVQSAVVNKNSPSPIIIAHRGASGYLPEHSMEAKVLAFAQGADFIEQDLVMTQDDRVVVLHEHTLNRVTDVAQRFPKRQRADGLFYVIDFTLKELKTLKVMNGSRVTAKGQRVPEWPERFSVKAADFSIHTFEEEIELIQELNRLFSKNIGIYPEIKSPWFHSQEGKDISRFVLNILKDYGYQDRQQSVYLQSFDPNELQRIKHQLFPELKMDIPLVQLIALTHWQETYELNKDQQWVVYDYQWMFAEGGMQKIKTYADGIGPWKPFIISETNTAKGYRISDMVQRAKAAGLVIHPYTFRADSDRIPKWATSYEHMIQVFTKEAKVDGIFTDFPDKTKDSIARFE